MHSAIVTKMITSIGNTSNQDHKTTMNTHSQYSCPQSRIRVQWIIHTNEPSKNGELCNKHIPMLLRMHTSIHRNSTNNQHTDFHTNKLIHGTHIPTKHLLRMLNTKWNIKQSRSRNRHNYGKWYCTHMDRYSCE